MSLQHSSLESTRLTGREGQSPRKRSWETWAHTCERTALELPYPPPKSERKTGSKPKCKTEIMELLGETVGEDVLDVGLGSEFFFFLDITAKYKPQKEK